ncbi:F-box domain-containing protein [Caenorhabditis elegans]|uniref:F-box domain-containing protein n=1 Tax=Caenorhabditis elegans TaxID=6239 RepID=Q2V079_CAEEL|nr:F-box domain-containing protein [Caenorhabditis elegans]CCD67488.1 F-box domain-containing protein [Caenorhabditis elegans]|eukprot:NP_001040761.1 F-box B protein [Caenorhabditis elegans]
MVAPSFPIHSLPTKPLKIVLQSFTHCSIIPYSFISNKAKNLVKTSGRLFQAKILDIEISNRLVVIIALHGESFNCRIPLNGLNNPQQVRIWHHSLRKKFYLNGYSVRSFIDHFMQATNGRQIERIHFLCDLDLLDDRFLRDHLSGFSYHKVIIDFQGRSVSPEHLKYLAPFLQSEQLDLRRATFDAPTTRCILAPNWDKIYLRSSNDLNELLLNNGSDIQVQRSMLSNTDINIFLKNWRNGSNPRLEFVQIWFSIERDLDRSVILKEIECHPVSNDELARRRELPFLAQIAIRKPDGTMAAIKFHRSQFQMVVFGYYPL